MSDRLNLSPSTRKKIEYALDKLIALLDAVEPDPDLEESDPAEPVGDDEPSLGATEALNQERAWRTPVAPGIDLEFDGDTTPSADAEPSLGSLNNYSGNGDQSGWGEGSADDSEDDSSDDEPSLGSRDKEIDQRSWHHGFDNDCELDTSDTEPSLGSPELCPQVHWAQGARDDREDDDEREWDQAEDGIGDSDGLIEQCHGCFGERCE